MNKKREKFTIMNKDTRLKIEVKKKSKGKEKEKISFDCTLENYEALRKLTEKTGRTRNELINILLEFAMGCVDIID